MPRNTVPKYRKQTRAGRPALAFVELNGTRHYLGDHGTADSRARYATMLGEWEARGRQPLVEQHELTIGELAAAFWGWAEGYYLKPDGRPTGETSNLRDAMRFPVKLYGSTPAAEFGPTKLRAVRQSMIDAGLSRGVINSRVNRIRRAFKWAAGRELLPASVLHALQAVEPLRAGRSEARESTPVRSVADAFIDATRSHMTSVLRGMVDVQRATGMRPGEICILRGCDLDTTGDVWTYRPADHKTQHHGRERIIYLGPRAQEAIKPHLRANLQEYLFRPCDSEAERLAELHAARATPMSCGNVPGSNRVEHPRRKPGSHYTTKTYRGAIWRACDRAFPVPENVTGKDAEAWRRQYRWNPNQLRHSFATQVRREHGLEAAQVLLGHAQADITQLYAERDSARAVEVISRIG